MRWFVFVLLSLSAYRFQRVFVTDDWPPSRYLRVRATRLNETLGEFIYCHWCAGTLLSALAVYLTHRYVYTLTPHWGLWAAAVSTVVGLIGDRNED